MNKYQAEQLLADVTADQRYNLLKRGIASTMSDLNNDIRKFILEESETIRQRHGGWESYVNSTEQRILDLERRIKSQPKDPGRKVIFDTGVKAFCQTLQASLDEGWAVEVISWTEHCQMVAGLAVLVKA